MVNKNPLVILSAHCAPSPTSAAEIMSSLGEQYTKSREVYFITQTKFAFGENSTFGLIYGIKNPFLKSENRFLRFFGEIFCPLFLAIFFGIYLRLRLKTYDVIGYSPTALQFPLYFVFKKKAVTSILILRDIFPLWMADAGLINKQSFIFKILEFISQIQYRLVDYIAVQHQSDIKLLPSRFQEKCFELASFYSDPPSNGFISPDKSAYFNLGCFGTFGAAQGWEVAILILDKILREHDEVNISFFGSNNSSLSKNCFSLEVRDRVHIRPALYGPELISELNCIDVGFFALSDQLLNSNIPGKFINYCRYGIPTFALCDINSHVAELVRNHNLGCVLPINDVEFTVKQFREFKPTLKTLNRDLITDYFSEYHSVRSATKKLDRVLHDN